jgi:hypothetical protein
MIIMVSGKVFGLEPQQRARIIDIDTDENTLVIRSCGDPRKIAEITPEQVEGVELTDGGTASCTIFFNVKGVSFTRV